MSVLPFYDSIERQNARKWWVYDKVYPLFVPSGYMLPFQVMRPSRTELVKGDLMISVDSDNGYLTNDGSWYQDVNSGSVNEYDVTGIDAVYLSNVAVSIRGGEHSQDSVSYVAYDSTDKVLFAQKVRGRAYSGFWTLPKGTTKIRVLTYNEEVEENYGEVYKAKSVPTTIKSFKIYTRCNELVGDVIVDMKASGLTIKHIQSQDIDVIVYSGIFPISQVLVNGQYYAEMSDGTDTWYSEIFTISEAASSYLKIEWWDVEDFMMDAGTIVYTEPTYRNRLYIPTDIAKPEYIFEEDGETRDGYFFPAKQISEKRYKFTFLASEYLLDVLRFVRMADFVRITKNGQTYDVDSFLITPEWEDEGDVAVVQAEFDTQTVAKKIGRAYASISGDFNNDYNNDYLTK